MSEWISVKDKLPEFDFHRSDRYLMSEYVLAVHYGCVGVAQLVARLRPEDTIILFTGEEPRASTVLATEMGWDFGEGLTPMVTHWMPLPAAPSQPTGEPAGEGLG